MKHLRQITEAWHVVDTDTGKRVYTHDGYGFASVQSSKHAARLNNNEYNTSKRWDRYKITTDDKDTPARKASGGIDGNGNVKNTKTQKTSTSSSKTKPKNKIINKKNAVKSIALMAAYKGLKQILGKR